MGTVLEREASRVSLKTIVVPTLGWPDDDVAAFVSYVEGVSRDLGEEVEIIESENFGLEITIDSKALYLKDLILSSQPL